MGRLKSEFFEDGKLKPREKMKMSGVYSLEDEELLAIILNTGNRNEDVLHLSRRLIHERGGLKGVFFSDDIIMEKGIKEAKGYRIMAIREIMKRIPLEHALPVLSEDDAFQLTRFYFLSQNVEICVCLILDEKKRIISKMLFQSDERQKVHVPINSIIKETLARSASFVLLLHNHPSGEMRFSSADLEIAHEIYFKLSLVQVVLLDCIVISDDCHISMRKAHLGPFL